MAYQTLPPGSMYVASVSMLVKVSVCSSPTTPKSLAFNSGLLLAVQVHKRIRQGFISPGRSSRESRCAGPHGLCKKLPGFPLPPLITIQSCAQQLKLQDALGPEPVSRFFGLLPPPLAQKMTLLRFPRWPRCTGSPGPAK